MGHRKNKNKLGVADPKTGVIVGGQPPKTNHKFDLKKVGFGIVIFLLLISLTSVAIFLVNKQKNKTVCSESFLKEAAPLLEPQKVNDLQPLTKQISEKSGYKTDVNCLYVLVVYDINIGDSVSLQTHYDELASVYDSQVGYSSALGRSTLSPDAIKQTLEFLKAQSEEMKNNVFYGPSV